MQQKHSFWKYSLFQKPATLLILCLMAMGLIAVLNLSCSGFWIGLFAGLAWISSMWILVLPLDQFLQTVLGLKMGLAGRIVICHALFWTIATLVVLLSVLPALRQSCTHVTVQPISEPIVSPVVILSPTPAPPATGVNPTPLLETTSSPTPRHNPVIEQELVNLDWSLWRANIWNHMFLDQRLGGEPGSEAKFSFMVHRDGRIEDIEIRTDDPMLEESVKIRIESLVGTDTLTFVESTRRDTVHYEDKVIVCTPSIDLGCNAPADPSKYPDQESFTKTVVKSETP